MQHELLDGRPMAPQLEQQSVRRQRPHVDDGTMGARQQPAPGDPASGPAAPGAAAPRDEASALWPARRPFRFRPAAACAAAVCGGRRRRLERGLHAVAEERGLELAAVLGRADAPDLDEPVVRAGEEERLARVRQQATDPRHVPLERGLAQAPVQVPHLYRVIVRAGEDATAVNGDGADAGVVARERRGGEKRRRASEPRLARAPGRRVGGTGQVGLVLQPQAAAQTALVRCGRRRLGPVHARRRGNRRLVRSTFHRCSQDKKIIDKKQAQVFT
eukprot:scaffold26461_cov101-Isochrysis_galbana.AAC.2